MAATSTSTSTSTSTQSHTRRQPARLTSSQDPFIDPAAPTRAHNHKSKRPPPPPPPRTMSAAVQSSRNSSQNDIADAVRDTVVLRTQLDSRSKVPRSQTTVPSAPVSSRPAGKRSQSDDSANVPDKNRSSAKSRSKKGSQHADVIDRLDFTGVGPMFHHDGPFDACAPSRNKHRNKAPMYAWALDDSPAPQYGDSAYPSPAAYKAFTNDYPDPPKKKVDAIAEAWGIHEPEPFEEFFAGGGSSRQDGDTPASSIYNGKERATQQQPTSSTRRPKDNRDPARANNNIAARRSMVPPPQPIFVAEPEPDFQTGSPPATSPGFPKRSKSIMHRFRKMRDAPNVPVTPDYEDESRPPLPTPSSPTDQPNSARPTHRPQNSFLGRFSGNSRSHHQHQQSVEKPEPFVYIEAHTNHNKDLPAPPPMGDEPSTSGEAYYDGNASTSPPGGGGGLGRKTSLMKKVGRAVRGTK